MAKKQYLAYEIHLNDPDRVTALQASPPGATIVQGSETHIFRSPTEAATEFKDELIGDGSPLPFVNYFGQPVVPPGRTYIWSSWFTAGSPEWSKNFPVDEATFTRKSGGWFGIPFLFPSTTRYYWIGKFVYDAPATQTGAPGGPASTPISQRRWIDCFPGNMGATPANPTAPEQEYSMTRDAANNVDTFGLGLRGITGSRQHSLTEYTGGGGSTENLSWERLYIRWRKSGSSQTLWRAYNTAGGQIRAELQITPLGQLAIYGVDNGGNYNLLGTVGQFVLGKFQKVDLIVRMAITVAAVPKHGTLFIYLDGEPMTQADFPPGFGPGATGFHARSEIGTPAGTGWSGEFDVAFWMNALPPFTLGGDGQKIPVLTGTDFKLGSRAVLVRANGDDASRAGWTGDWRLLSTMLTRTLNTGPTLTSTTALARLAVTTDFARSLNALPGSKGCVGFVVCCHGYRGTNNGRLGYKLNAGADVFRILGAPDSLNNEGVNSNARSWGSMMYNPLPGATPTPITDLVLLREKGNDAVDSGTDHLSAVAEVIGTFHDEDYDSSLDPALRNPLPFLGVHNSPYPRSPWATSSVPPISPVIIKSGTYVGTGTFKDLTFKAPVNWLWIQRTTTLGTPPEAFTWFSSMLGALLGCKKAPEPWTLPNLEIDPAFTTVATDNPPTGVGAVPDRSAQVAATVAANLTMLDGDEDHKRDLLGVIIRALNTDNPGDGNNWGFLKKTDAGDVIPADIIVWNPSREHFDVLTDTGATWIADGVMANPAWIWLQAKDEGQQEEQTVVRIASAATEVNQAGETYQYIAVSDPGMRFMLNGAFAHHDVAMPAIDPLISPNYTPIGAFFVDQRPGVDTNRELQYKGPGHAASEGTKLNLATTTQAQVLTFSAGLLTSDVNLSSITDTHCCYNCWRRDDGSGDPGVTRVVQLTSYVGNGVNPRNINLLPASGKRPLFALVVPHASGNPFFKHPGQSGGNSSSVNGVHVTTAIIGGGVDSLTIQNSINGNGVVYDVFVLVGGDTAGADGFSIDGEFIPVEPTSPPGGGAFGEDPEDPVEDDGSGGGEAGDGVDDPPEVPADFEGLCLTPSLRVVNIALSRIGEGKPVAVISELTKEAQLARLHYDDAVETTLRDFPWPFATRYQTLVLVATPANRDWLYSYRQPADCIFERRIVMARQGGVNPTPPPMALSSDADGRLIYTNQANAILEYTRRPGCSAGLGDPLFRDALAWRLAADMAPALTRIADVIKHCTDQYTAAINRAIDVIRPGNPGQPTDVDPLDQDTGTGCLAANIAVVNRALIRIGAQTIANLATEQSREAEAARLIFEAELRATLRDYPWAFATRYENALALVTGSAAVPVNDDWTFSYRYPTDAVFIRRIVTGFQRGFDPNPPTFRMGTDGVGRVLYTNLENPPIEYTARIACVVGRADDLFRDALAWRLAAALAPSLAQVDPAAIEQAGRGPQERPRERKATEAQLRARATDFAWRMYQSVLVKARVADANEVQQEPPGDAEWIRGRN